MIRGCYSLISFSLYASSLAMLLLKIVGKLDITYFHAALPAVFAVAISFGMLVGALLIAESQIRARKP